jgi:hypothetical protein
MVALDFTPYIQRSTALTQCEEKSLRTSEKLGRAFRSNARFVFLLVLVLSIAVLVLVLEAIQYSNPACWSASYRKPPRSTIGNAAVPTAIEYEYRFTEYEYEYDEIRCDVRKNPMDCLR